MSPFRTAALAVALLVTAAATAHGQLDPNAFTSLGAINVSSGTLTINTDTLAMSGAASFTGVALNQAGGPQVAVFDFSSITVGTGVTVSLIGSRPLALLSRGNATIQATLAVPTGLNGNSVPYLGGYAGGYVNSDDFLGSTTQTLELGQGGGGPGGGGAIASFSGSAAGGGGYGGKGGPTLGGLSGLPYGNLAQTLQGGGGGGAVANMDANGNGASARAAAGAGGGALGIVATGTLTVAAMSAVGTGGSGSAFSDPQAGGQSFFLAAGGAGGGILLSGGTGLTLTGSLDVHGGNASASTGLGNTSAGGGGRIALSGLSSYTLGSNPFSFNLNGGNGAGNGYAGVITVDALSTTIPNGTSVTLNGTPFISVAGSTTQTGATIEAYARHDVNVNGTAVLAATNACQNLFVNGTAVLGATNACQDLNVTGTVTLGANNAFQRLNAAGTNVTSLALFGTFDLNGFSQAVDTFSEFAGSPALVKLPAGSTLTVGVGGASNTYVGQIFGAGAFVKAGAGTQTLSGTSLGFTGPTTVTGGTLIVRDQALPGSTVTVAGGNLSFSLDSDPVLGALAGTGSISLQGGALGINSFTVGGDGASTTYTGSLSGSAPGGVIKVGAGTWALNGTNTFSGPLKVQAGTVLIGSPSALSPSTTGVTVTNAGTLDLNGYNEAVTAANPLTVQGNLRLGGAGVSVANGGTATYDGGFVGNGFLRGPGTHVVTGGAFLSGITTLNSTIISQTGAGTLTNFTNGGTVTVAGGLAGGVTYDGFTNQGSGSITIGAVSKVQASDFQSYGTLTINPATVTENFSQTTLMTNTGPSPLYFNGGSRTFVGTPATAVFPPSSPEHGQPTFVAGIDLNGKNAIVAGGLFVNNGYVEDSTNNFQGTATVVADFGSLVKGAGFFQNTVLTQNGGKFQAGNSPGAVTFGKFVLGPGGVSSYVFSIDDATGAAGPSPDATGHVSGWGLVRVGAPPVTHGGLNTNGDFVWTATPSDKVTVSLQTLLNPTTVGVDVPGMMDHFDPSRPYSWPAVEWTGSYAGPTDVAILDGSTAFDASEFANPIAGSFGWALDAGDPSLSLTYTPSAVPEPGTLALVGAAGLAVRLVRRRRRP